MNTLSFPGLGIGEFELNEKAFLNVHWYALIIMTGIIVAVLYVWFRFREYKFKTDDLIDMAIWVIISGIIGARLYFILFKLDYYIVLPEDLGGTDSFFANLGESLRRMIAVWEGGLGIYGGVIAGGIAGCLVAKHKKMNILQTLDFLAPGVMLAQSIGRWGNFFNVEAFGGLTDGPLRMCSPTIANYLARHDYIEYNSTEYAQILSGELGVHPTFFYESMWNLVGFLAIWLIFVQIPKTKKFHKFHGQIFYMYLIWYGLGRFWIEGLRTDSLYLIEGVIRISQLVALLSLIVGTALMIYSFVKLHRREENTLVKVLNREAIIAENEKKLNEEESKQKEEKNNGTNNKRETGVSKSKRKTKK